MPDVTSLPFHPAGIAQFLRNYPPFADMGSTALAFLASRLEAQDFPAGATVLAPNDASHRQLYILAAGSVQAQQAGDLNLTDRSAYAVQAGQCFPLGAVASATPAAFAYTAAGDIVCWRLASADFFQLLVMSPEFSRFVLTHVAGLLEQSRRQLELQFGQANSEQATLNTPLSAMLRVAPVTVPPGIPIRDAVDIMARAKVGSVVVVDAERRPLGIFTQSDVLRRVVVPSVPMTTPVDDVMSAAPATISHHATSYDAMLTLATHGIRHLVVVDAEDRIAGVVSERDLFAMQRVGLRNIRKLIASAADMEALRQAAADVRRLTFSMMGQGVSAEKLTAFISGLNDQLTRRVIALQLGGHDLYGVDWAWLAFGSEGRDEQTFSTDQDNGIVFACPDFADKEELKIRLLEFARDVNEGLAQIGFPLCKGNIMAGNPQWCLTLEEWKEQFSGWIRKPEPEALLNATIFFDFRTLHGNEGLAKALRKWLLAQTRGATLFLRLMAENANKVAPPLGLIRDFSYDNNPDFPHTIDLKAFGARLFVDSARIIALANEIPYTSTAERLRAAAEAEKLGKEDIHAVVEGFFFIQQLRLKNQRAGAAPGAENRVNPDDLNELDRHVLKEAFKQAKKLQSRLQLEYRL